MRKLHGGRVAIILGAASLIAICPVLAPQLLAFPYKSHTEIGTVWSEQTLSDEVLEQVASDTKLRLATSSLADAEETRPIFLTNGGWRWLWLANASKGSFALTRPLTKAVVVNAVNPQTTVISNGAEIGGQRKLAPILAHEFTHGMIRRKYGILTAQMLPTWKVEGYCDHVAGESSLTAAEAAKLEASHNEHPALPYYHGRLRVAAILDANGGSVDTLFETEH